MASKCILLQKFYFQKCFFFFFVSVNWFYVHPVIGCFGLKEKPILLQCATVLVLGVCRLVLTLLRTTTIESPVFLGGTKINKMFVCFVMNVKTLWYIQYLSILTMLRPNGFINLESFAYILKICRFLGSVLWIMTMKSAIVLAEESE